MISFFATILHSWSEYFNVQMVTQFKSWLLTRLLSGFTRWAHGNLTRIYIISTAINFIVQPSNVTHIVFLSFCSSLFFFNPLIIRKERQEILVPLKGTKIPDMSWGLFSQLPRKLFRAQKAILNSLYFKTEKSIGLKLCIKGTSVYMKSIMKLNSSVIIRFEISV